MGLAGEHGLEVKIVPTSHTSVWIVILLKIFCNRRDGGMEVTMTKIILVAFIAFLLFYSIHNLTTRYEIAGKDAPIVQRRTCT